jgi:hypothetical protein
MMRRLLPGLPFARFESTDILLVIRLASATEDLTCAPWESIGTFA